MMYADSYHADPADIAADRLARRRSVSCTPSCTGCSDPQCGYCDDIREQTHAERVDAERTKIVRSTSLLLDCFDECFAADQHVRIAEALRLVLDRDDFAAGDILRELLLPRVDALAERRAA